MDISTLLRPERILTLGARYQTKEAALKALAKALAKTDEVPSERELSKTIADRERILSTGIGYGVAIPHARLKDATGFVAALGISKEGVAFESLDGKPVHVIVMIAGPQDLNEVYVATMSAYAGALKREGTLRRIVTAAKNPEKVISIISESAGG